MEMTELALIQKIVSTFRASLSRIHSSRLIVLNYRSLCCVVNTSTILYDVIHQKLLISKHSGQS